ncbi:O-antigen ligase family protein [Paraeggerthella hongkongensis]|uniref:O-antigen ligase family protein n=1 Tax=Paraeggerthella hominis TaxID=2897351 RepID=UPI001C126F38|nr:MULTISPECIES: O-antigen ligase family protein [Paraeggerthella]MBU5405332.1 O-antigen ligase family protein [Paraeggerthella hongkongensis]MCD2433298.1 O-antigen ligase family protein [Paraeggerthella hominis]
MNDLFLFRFLFQFGEQYLHGLTYAFSALLLLAFVYCLLKLELRLNRLDYLFAAYLIITAAVSVANNCPISAIVEQYNKLLLFYTAFLCLRQHSIKLVFPKLYGWFKVAVYALCTTVFILALMPTSYVVQWGTRTLIMAFGHQHLAASFIVLLLSLLYLEMKVSGFAFWKLLFTTAMLVPLFMTGARTIAVCGIAYYVLIAYDYWGKIKGGQKAFLIVGAAVVVIALIAPNIDSLAFFQKNDNVVGSSFGNGREDIWAYYIGLYSQYSVPEKLFGTGAGFYLNGYVASTAGNLGAHNDFLTFLLAYGCFGLVLYVSFVFSCLFKGLFGAKTAVIALVFVFAAGTNGYFGYTELVVSTVVMVICIGYFFDGAEFRRTKMKLPGGINRGDANE